jgi:hypothetical protein
MTMETRNGLLTTIIGFRLKAQGLWHRAQACLPQAGLEA